MKKTIPIMLSLLMLLILCSCTKKAPSPKEKVPLSQEKQIAAILYYANEKYIETGDEELEKFIVVKKQIPIKNDNILLSILNQLKKVPDIENATTGIPSGIKFLNAKLENKTAYVDLSSENLSGGSLKEFFVIYQIVYSLTSLETIDQVQFLVDGKKEETLMGHFLIAQPLKNNLNTQ
ncbi:MAG: GerMN domain-containing protein [Marinisporobacter sp.]|jgi:spore germination protein GerM|nr:GerMN domain-containing protein [Marinisporobacter sp.]